MSVVYRRGPKQPHVDRDRRVPSRSVACPQCGVQAQEKCLDANGQERESAHQVRRRMALRAEQGGPSVLGTHV